MGYLVPHRRSLVTHATTTKSWLVFGLREKYGSHRLPWFTSCVDCSHNYIGRFIRHGFSSATTSVTN